MSRTYIEIKTVGDLMFNLKGVALATPIRGLSDDEPVAIELTWAGRPNHARLVRIGPEIEEDDDEFGQVRLEDDE